jgi:predicted metal-dependent HD superfamily phosphohydrolase
MESRWVDAVRTVGGDPAAARTAASDLVTRYAEPHRGYHNGTHVAAVVRDTEMLAVELGLPETDRALLTLAACAHDVVYDGRPGCDERRSAEWAAANLSGAGVARAHVERVEALVLATLTHTAAPGDLAAQCLLDADLAVLGADPKAYERYRRAVRAEYAAYDDDAWRTGRTAVMSGLLAHDPLYATAPARQRWESAARTNITAELRALA